uniref:Uncharacterized protein n=1 Tax=Arundo donax TaxID=35708 RepID=A0A0A9DQD6_ARUDO
MAASTIIQTPRIIDKENMDPDDTIEWLHRNDNHVRINVNTIEPSATIQMTNTATQGVSCIIA